MIGNNEMNGKMLNEFKFCRLFASPRLPLKFHCTSLKKYVQTLTFLADEKLHFPSLSSSAAVNRKIKVFLFCIFCVFSPTRATRSQKPKHYRLKSSIWVFQFKFIFHGDWTIPLWKIITFIFGDSSARVSRTRRDMTAEHSAIALTTSC